MTLSISGKPDRKRIAHYGDTGAARSVVLNSFLKSVYEGSSVRIEGAEIKGNEIEMDLLLDKRDAETFRGRSLFSNLPLSFSYSRNGQDTAQLRFSLDSSFAYIAVFLSPKGFHKTVDGIFGTRKLSYLIEPDPTLEQVGLEAPESLEVELEYKTPPAVWRTLPREFIDNVQEYKFSGTIFTLAWPEESGQYTKTKEPEKLRVSQDDILRRVPEEVFEEFKKELISTGLVEYCTTEGTSSSKGFFRVKNPKAMIGYEAMQRLEEIVRQHVPDKEVRIQDRGAQIKISGNMSRDAFYLVHPIFDESEHCRVSSSVKGGNIKVVSEGYKSEPVTTTLKEATFEDIEMLTLTQAFEGSSLHIFAHRGDEHKGEAVCKKISI